MIAKFLTSRLAGPILLALLGSLAAALGVTAYRLDQANALATSRGQTIASQELLIASQIGQLAVRENLIASQNAGIEAIRRQRAEDREVYLRQYAQADERAKSNDARAQQLLGLNRTFATEVEQCRAAHSLLIEELTQ